MCGDTHWTVEIYLPYYTGEFRWRSIYGGESEVLARRFLDSERRAGNRARLRCWTPAVVDADDVDDILPDAAYRPSPNELVDSIPF